MAPSATDPEMGGTIGEDLVVSGLRKTLTNESNSLALRFRALFSLKHLACLDPPTEQTIRAISAIAAAFTSPSALLKHELAYCLGQTRNLASVPFLRRVLEDKREDSMCRHEAAEALGALGDLDSLKLLRSLRDDETEVEVVRETCDIAVERIEWENSDYGKGEILRRRLATELQEPICCLQTDYLKQRFLVDRSSAAITTDSPEAFHLRAAGYFTGHKSASFPPLQGYVRPPRPLIASRSTHRRTRR